MKQIIKFVVSILAVPIIAMLKNPNQLSPKHRAHLENIKLQRSTALLAMICVALACILILANIARF